ncbi:metal-dependent transcriptional regulator [Jeotgalibaca ciconiae]|uniref:Manganese transport regulator n=1 Tax=Jeotgalibaca ciconiae TaxID=2496265 RepID=A0A3Q9BK20_9LACT|nr:metal-dependent transcriptional regulator [Jeotgalibaca ciconiae]AZP04224.1 metal-dependent transcriptional regulator [Jeotgalibaca ciconiae]HJB24833.1 metal-dependent transcriptional regulator [Candidatus Jeotgalibaca pullicola]
MTPSKGDFLKAIVKLGGGERRVNNKDLAKELRISSAAVTDMALKLMDDGYINYIPYKGIKITETGRRETNKLIRKHRLWEVFLYEKLGYNWNQVHADADLLEHASSDFLIERLNEFLGFPTMDPHGEFIPNAEGEVESSTSLPLNELEAGKSFIITEVSDNTAFLNYLLQKNITLHDKYYLVEIEEYEGALLLEDEEGNQKRISANTASQIKVHVN